MTSVGDLEWRRWEQAWETVGDDATERWIRRTVERHSRLLRWLVVLEILVTIVMLGATVVAVRGLPANTGAAVIGAAALHALVVWGFTLKNRAGTWAPLGQSVRDYVLLARERCHRERRTARFVIGLLAVEAVAMAIWVTVRDGRPVGSPPPAPWWWVPPSLVTVGAVVWAIALEWRARHRLVRLDGAARDLGIDPREAAGAS